MTQGSAIVYCFRCAVRLTARDFDHGGATRFADASGCSRCSRELLESMSAPAQKAFAELIERTYAAGRRSGYRARPRGGS